MTDYKAMYLLLFNAVTDALEKMDRQNYGEASALLIAAQQKLSLNHISEPTRLRRISYAVFRLKKKNSGGI